MRRPFLLTLFELLAVRCGSIGGKRRQVGSSNSDEGFKGEADIISDNAGEGFGLALEHSLLMDLAQLREQPEHKLSLFDNRMRRQIQEPEDHSLVVKA